MSVTLNDLENFCLRTGWADSSERGLLNLFVRINATIRHLARLRAWYCYQKLGSLQTKAPYTTGTVAVSVASPTVTGMLTVWTSAMVGQEFYGPDARTYTILTVDSPTTLTLEESYMGATVASGGAYGIRYVRYAVPSGFDRVGKMRNRLGGELLDGQDVGEWLHRRRNSPTTTTYPTKVWATEEYFYVDPAPSQADQITYTYQKLPTELVANAEVTDWPDRLMWLLYAALDKSAKAASEAEAQAALELDQFQMLVDKAWLSCRPSSVPIGGNGGDDVIGANTRAAKYIFPNDEV
jgi:hypothetical protein